MLFQKKLDLIYLKNIKVNCQSDTKDNVIREIGKMLVDTGYVEENYVDGMLEREKSFSTYMGNGLALPHGVEEAKKSVKQSGIAVMIFPDGTPWGNETARIVVGVAGVGDEHLDILALVAEKMLSEEDVEALLTSDEQGVYDILHQ